ncbi:MAG: prepilin peptidase [Proteobacteria bacterium]|nr:prepilin peptidase [Pseudomonadota bacterium]
MHYVALAVFALALLAAAAYDLATFEIPDSLSIAIVAAFLVAAFGRLGLADIGWHLAVGLAVFAVGAVLFAIGYMGGGDVKLLAASVTWVGWPGLLRYLVFVAAAGGIIAAALLVMRALWATRAQSAPAWLRRLLSKDQGMPYATAIAAGGWAVMGSLARP